MIYLVIYLSGVIATYVLLKWSRNRLNQNTWEDVIVTIFVSLFSWIAFTLLGLGIIKKLLSTLIKHIIEKTEPPKWL